MRSHQQQQAQLADEEVEPQEVDTVASELAFMIQPLALYMRFVSLRAEVQQQDRPMVEGGRGMA